MQPRHRSPPVNAQDKTPTAQHTEAWAVITADRYVDACSPFALCLTGQLNALRLRAPIWSWVSKVPSSRQQLKVDQAMILCTDEPQVGVQDQIQIMCDGR